MSCQVGPLLKIIPKEEGAAGCHCKLSSQEKRAGAMGALCCALRRRDQGHTDPRSDRCLGLERSRWGRLAFSVAPVSSATTSLLAFPTLPCVLPTGGKPHLTTEKNLCLFPVY